ncbi:MAG: 30S ribosomal protein S6 [Candidatus Dependentiae bacterium]|nr:30S ribosomal protein S6 [Candidatus Dependentiae bacterium]
MITYEVLILTVPTITQDETKNLETQCERVIKENKGNTISFERWGKYRLAYPVKKNDYGVYFLARFESEEPGVIVEAIRTLMTVRLNDLVMRHMATLLDPKRSLAYQRPQSLEEAPVREVGGFMADKRDQRNAMNNEEDDMSEEFAQ